MELPSEEQMQKVLDKLKARDPLFNERIEFGKMLMLQYETMDEGQLKRYNELQEILKHGKE